MDEFEDAVNLTFNYTYFNFKDPYDKLRYWIVW